MKAIEARPEGVVLHLHVQPGASRTEVAGSHGGRLKMRVSAPPVEGAANKELLRFLAKRAGLRKSQAVLLSGETSRQKTVLLAGITLAEWSMSSLARDIGGVLDQG